MIETIGSTSGGIEELTSYVPDRVKRPYCYYVSYSWSDGGNSGFGCTTIDTDKKMDTSDGITAVRKYMEGAETVRGTRIVIVFFTQLRTD